MHGHAEGRCQMSEQLQPQQLSNAYTHSLGNSSLAKANPP